MTSSAVGVELGSQLQSATTADIADSAAPEDVLEAMREACGLDPVAYARLLELHVLAGLDELQVIAWISTGERGHQDLTGHAASTAAAVRPPQTVTPVRRTTVPPARRRHPSHRARPDGGA